MLKAGISLVAISTMFCIYASITLFKEYILTSNANLAS